MNTLDPSRLRALFTGAANLFALALAAAALTACNGTAVVTMTSSASTDAFLVYRVGLVSVQLETSGGGAPLTVLPVAASATVDLARLTGVSEVLAAAGAGKGKYTKALITLDYAAAQIVYDDGSLDGLTLTPVAANGRALGTVQLTVNLDPSEPFSVAAKGASQLALDFDLAASNVVDVSARTVSVAPMIVASATAIDSKPVRIRGTLAGVSGASLSTAATSFIVGIMPFDTSAAGSSRLSVITSDTTTYEINGLPSAGSAGLSTLAGLGTTSLAVAYGTLNAADQTTTTTAAGTGSTDSTAQVTFTANQVLAGGSVGGARLDRISGVVLGRSGTTVALQNATLIAADGTDSFIPGTSTVTMGLNTLVTVAGQGDGPISNLQQVSIGSRIDAFGVLVNQSTLGAALDASAGRVRLNPSSAAGLVTAAGSGLLTVSLTSLDGRAASEFDFVASGASAGAYAIDTGAADLTNAVAGAPVVASGMPGSYGAGSPNFTAATLLDPTTIEAQLSVDWVGGTVQPFTAYDSTAIDLDVHNSAIGTRHEIQVGAQNIDIASLASDPIITPNASSSAVVFAIGHAASSNVESFNTYAAFIARLQTELNAGKLATGMSAAGQYSAATFAFSAARITIVMND